MFKLAGGIMITAASFFIFNINVYRDYCTYTFLDKTLDVIRHIAGESGMNYTYEKVFEKINFNPDTFVDKALQSGCVYSKEAMAVKEFFSQLGKRSRGAEQQYINYAAEKFTDKKQYYSKRYHTNRKVYGISGMSVGIMLTLLLI